MADYTLEWVLKDADVWEKEIRFMRIYVSLGPVKKVSNLIVGL